MVMVIDRTDVASAFGNDGSNLDELDFSGGLSNHWSYGTKGLNL